MKKDKSLTVRVTEKHPGYTLVGGNPFHDYKGTTIFGSLSVVGTFERLHKALQAYQENWENYGGLLIIIDLETGLAVEE